VGDVKLPAVAAVLHPPADEAGVVAFTEVGEGADCGEGLAGAADEQPVAAAVLGAPQDTQHLRVTARVWRS
jgi:hypothetical protein